MSDTKTIPASETDSKTALTSNPSNPSISISNANQKSSASVPILRVPMDGEDIEEPLVRYTAWHNLAVRKYNNQAACYGRGKSRFDSLIEYDATHDVIRWNGAMIPGSKRLFSNVTTSVTRMGRVILTLMVKNESAIVARALESIRDDIDGFVILDTGSTDNTPQIMWDILTEKYHKPGVIYLAPFEDFGTNRSILTQVAYKTGDWLLLFDADYKLEKVDKNWKSKLDTLDKSIGQVLLYTTGNTKYARPHLVRGDIRWCYVCRTHENLSRSKFDPVTSHYNSTTLEEVLIDHVADGGCKYDKAPRDIVMLMMDLMDDPQSERAYFYLGNSLNNYRNKQTGQGMPVQALVAYHKAMNLCKWNEELVMSAFECQKSLMETHRPDLVRIVVNLLHAMEANPERLEVIYGFLRNMRHHDHPERDWIKHRTRTPHDSQKFFPHLNHFALCLGSFFTHNTYPSHQALFVDVEIHNNCFWEEMIRAASIEPLYFRLGCYLSRKWLASPEFAKKSHYDQDAIRNQVKSWFELPCQHLVQSGAVQCPALKERLVVVAHRWFGSGKYREAKLLYEWAMQPVVNADVLMFMDAQDVKWFTGAQHTAERPKRKLFVEAAHTAGPNLSDPLTSWKAGKRQRLLEYDSKNHDMLLFQIGICAERLLEQKIQAEKDTNPYLNEEKFMARIVRLGYLIDCLKCNPFYAPALSVLYRSANIAPSKWTRCVTYAIRLVHSYIRDQGEREEAQLASKLQTSPVDTDSSDLVLADGTLVH